MKIKNFFQFYPFFCVTNYMKNFFSRKTLFYHILQNLYSDIISYHIISYHIYLSMCVYIFHRPSSRVAWMYKECSLESFWEFILGFYSITKLCERRIG